jgi:hypothetical protein
MEPDGAKRKEQFEGEGIIGSRSATRHHLKDVVKKFRYQKARILAFFEEERTESEDVWFICPIIVSAHEQ